MQRRRASQRENNKVVKVGYVVSHPIQYQVPLFRRMAHDAKIGFTALFGCHHGVGEGRDKGFGEVVDFGIPLLGGYQHKFLNPRGLGEVDSFLGLSAPWRGLRMALREQDVAVLHGWRSILMWQSALVCMSAGIPYLIRAEAPLIGKQQQRPFLKGLIWKLFVGVLLRNAAGCLAIGTANKRFYKWMGVPETRIRGMPYFVDNELVAVEAMHGANKRAEIRQSLGLKHSQVVAINVGKFVRRKRQDDLIAALPAVPDLVLLLVGSGPNEVTLRSLAQECGVGDRVIFGGFRSSPDVWRLMGASDFFVHSAEAEPWGLVVNEAIAAGLPVLVSDDTGAAEDLVRGKELGRIVPLGDRTAWVEALRDYTTRLPAKRGDSLYDRKLLLDAHSVETAAARLVEASVALSGC